VSVGQLRAGLVSALLGPNADEEMRLTRLTAAELRSDSALLIDAVKAVGFFPGPRAVQVDQATDGLTPVFEAALVRMATGRRADHRDRGRPAEAVLAEEAFRRVEDGPCRGDLRRSARARRDRGSPEGRRDRDVDRAAMVDLEALARTPVGGRFPADDRQARPLQARRREPRDPADLEAVAPLSREAELDDILHATAEAASGSIGPILSRLKAQGVAPVTLCIAALRHFRALHAAACHPGGAEAGLSAQRPPVFGPRRERLKRQVSRWGRPSWKPRSRCWWKPIWPCAPPPRHRRWR
jgi:DNA polymerase-3 subunit delta